ncbi:hypothetical protein [Bacillus sp. Marseille-P3800]|uniref:hypothetical protein n=1 Tax=Bacillus sp. Marseille-P3800 TaxID=2014782 RepID=UPI000C08C831|nr:hypothetical protein [Bacillus sp. Marseille-P3800]
MKKLKFFIFIPLSILMLHACVSNQEDPNVFKIEPTETELKDSGDKFRYLDQQSIDAGIQNRVYISSNQLDEAMVGEQDKSYPIQLTNGSFSDELDLDISIDNSKDETLELMLYFFIEGDLIGFSEFEAGPNMNNTYTLPLKVDSENVDEITVVQIDMNASKETYRELNASVARIVISDNENIVEDETIEVVSRSKEYVSHTYKLNSETTGMHTHDLLVENGNHSMNFSATQFTVDGEFNNLVFNEEIPPEKMNTFKMNQIDGKRNFILIQNNHGEGVLADLKSAISQDVDYMTTDAYIIELF